MLDLKEDDANVGMAMVMWQLWKDRNDAIWSYKIPNSSITIRLDNFARTEWQTTNGFPIDEAITTRRRTLANYYIS